MYTLVFSRRARRAFLDLPNREALRVKERLERLQENPRMRGTILRMFRSHLTDTVSASHPIDDENRA